MHIEKEINETAVIHASEAFCECSVVKYINKLKLSLWW